MKNVLAIEIKDNKTIVTLSKVLKNGNYSLLLHKQYGSKKLISSATGSTSSVQYDYSIPEKIANDLQQMNIFNDIDEKLLTINTQMVAIVVQNSEYKYNTDLVEAREKLLSNIKRTSPNVHLNNLVFSKDSDISLTKQNISATMELLHNDYINNIIDSFKKKGIEFTKIVPITQAIQNAAEKKSIDYGITMSVLVEEKFTQLTWLEQGRIVSSLKWQLGLSDIYQHISNIMQINKGIAKKLFKSFGSIPPEDVVDDKVIHTRENGKELEVFTKKDLSRFITEKVNELFANIKYHVDSAKSEEKQIRIIFNGEIKSLMGFKKYASKSFDEPNIKKYKTNVIGLTPETEFITMGLLLEADSNTYYNNGGNSHDEKKVEKLYTPKISLMKKVLRMYNYI